MGTNRKTGVLRSRHILRVKVDNKNFNQHFIKHDKDNNSEFKTIFLFKNLKGVLFILKPLTVFKTMFSDSEFNPQFKTKLSFHNLQTKSVKVKIIL